MITEKERLQDRKYYIRNHEKILTRDRENSTKPINRFQLAQWDAREHSREHNITLEQYVNLLSQGCYYCSKDLDTERGHSLDRIDNSKGYTLDNVLPCCGECNEARGNNYTVEEFQIMMNALLEFRMGKINEY